MSFEQIKNIIEPIISKYHVTHAGIFGSYAKNLQTESSDIDLLITYQKPFSYFDLVKLEQELEVVSGKSFDVITEDSLSPFIKNGVISESKTVYGKR
jgi:predicted nucleotidyltransferase